CLPSFLYEPSDRIPLCSSVSRFLILFCIPAFHIYPAGILNVSGPFCWAAGASRTAPTTSRFLFSSSSYEYPISPTSSTSGMALFSSKSLSSSSHYTCGPPYTSPHSLAAEFSISTFHHY